MITKELTALEIHKLSTRQFKTAKNNDDLDANAFYITPDDDSVGEKTEGGGEIFNDYENNKALGQYSHSEGCGTTANKDYQHVQGKYNLVDDNKNYAHIIGNGSAEILSNAHTVDWAGNAWYAGEITTGTSNAPHRGILIGKLSPIDSMGVDGDIYIMYEEDEVDE